MNSNKISFDLNNSSSQRVVLIFGISSFVGSNLAEVLKKDFKVIGTYFNNPVSIDGVVTFPCDVLKTSYELLGSASNAMIGETAPSGIG